MDTALEQATRPFIEVNEVWRPEGDRLVQAGGNYGDLADFEAASGRTSFAKGEGLPGKAWAEGRPVVLKEFDGSYFLRTDAAKEAGLTAAVAIPVFAEDELKAVLVVLCSDDDVRTGADEVFQIAIRVLDHQVHVEGQIGRPLRRVDDQRADRDVRHEVPVHDVDVHPVRPTVRDGPDVVREAAEVGRKNRGGDLHDGAGIGESGVSV